jgi:hypothetical protein
VIAPATTPDGDVRDRKLRELRRLLAAMLRAHDFESASAVRATIARVERGA